MNNGIMGFIGLIIGIGVLTGGETVAPGANTTWVGGIIVAGSLVLIALGTWEEYADKRLKVLGKEAAAAQIERLAMLREQGRLTEDEFISAKQHILGEEYEQEIPATEDDDGLPRLGHLARLKTQGVLTEEEFAAQKQAIFLEVNLKRLDRLYVENHLSQQEYQEQKEKLLGKDATACSGTEGPSYSEGGRG